MFCLRTDFDAQRDRCQTQRATRGRSRPSPASPGGRPGDEERERGVRPRVHRYGRNTDQFGELWLPAAGASPIGTVVLLHGGFWRARYSVSLGWPLAVDLAGRGYAVWNLEYRRVGKGGGWPATFADVAAGIDLLATLPVDTSRLVAIGHSAGGHLATWAAGRAGLPPGAPGRGRASS